MRRGWYVFAALGCGLLGYGAEAAAQVPPSPAAEATDDPEQPSGDDADETNETDDDEANEAQVGEPPPPAAPPPTGQTGQPPPPPPGYSYPYPYPRGQGAPGAPPPGYGYPPPGYAPQGYYPPGYYPPGYYPPPPQARAPEAPKPRLPDDAAVQTSPFLDLVLGGLHLDQRFDSFFNIGVQLGAYLGGMVRATGRVVLFPSEPDDDYSFGFDNLDGGNYITRDSESPALLYGGTLGIAMSNSTHFAFAPGLLFLRTDEGDYGSFLGLHAPFDWVTDSGVRIGFEVAVGRTFGGEVTGQCSNFGGPTPSCATGEVRQFDREAGSGFYSHFHMGWGFSRPEKVLR